jgi:hypothetical protein
VKSTFTIQKKELLCVKELINLEKELKLIMMIKNKGYGE